MDREAGPHHQAGGEVEEAVHGGHEHHHGHRKHRVPRIRERERRNSSGLVWALVILCTLLAVGVIIAGATVFAVYLIYKPKMPYLLVTDARLERLEYGQSGTILDLQVALTIQAENTNSKADATFSGVNLAVGFHGADVAFLRAGTFAVARRSAVPLRYQIVSVGRQLSPDGMQYMDGALRAGVVPLDLFGKARTTWKVGIFASLQFWTRISCRFLFNYPGNGTAMPYDCRSKSP
ncbi:unnamed protein product [Urochloa humidicola]